MDQFKKSNYEHKAHICYLTKRRQEFQSWIGDILRMSYGDDYQNIRLAQGDGGLDGVIFSSSTVVAVYAPRGWTDKVFASKVKSDFENGLKTLTEFNVTLKEWIFIHNDVDDIPAGVAGEVLQFKQSQKKVTVRFWSFKEIWAEILKLDKDQLIELLGEVPSLRDLEDLEYPDISEVITYITSKDSEGPPLRDIEIPDPGKLEYNDLEESKKELLKAGRSKHTLVEDYVEQMPDPTTGNRIAHRFQEKYKTLQSDGLPPNVIFNKLWVFAGGEHFTGADHVAAVTALLSYFFHRCDIFENPPVEG